MNTKLTLRLDEELIVKAKAYAERSGKSVSGLVSDYFSMLTATSRRCSRSPRGCTPFLGSSRAPTSTRRTTRGTSCASTDEGPLRHERRARRAAETRASRLDAARLLSMADTGVIDGVCVPTRSRPSTTSPPRSSDPPTAGACSVSCSASSRSCGRPGRARVALRLDFPDFEDAVVHEAALASGAAGIVTRDAAGFSRGTVP